MRHPATLLPALLLQVSVESVLRVVYQPQAVFRVRAVTRCTASMPGHAGEERHVAAELRA